MRWFVLLALALLSSCSCQSSKRSSIRIGVEPTFSPLNFEELQPYVNGYVEDLLLEIARYTGLHFEKITVSWDTLLEGVKEGKYDAILSSLPPYNFNLAKYDFSECFLDLGPILVIPINSQYSDLKSLSGELVGVITGDPSVLTIEKYPEVIIRAYDTIPNLLNAVVLGDLEAAVLDRLPALTHVQNLYSGQLKLANAPLTDMGLRAVAPKGEQERFLRLFNQALAELKRKKTVESLQKKWNL